jgi:hypothetical protein
VRVDALPPEALLVACALAALLALVQTLRLAWARWLPRRRLEAARAAGADGERRAEPLLVALGYAVVARQCPAGYDLVVDGERWAVSLRADLMVERDGRRYVAEVKTGRQAPRLETPATRRQLLEYGMAFDVDGVLLVDVDAGRVRSVEFPAAAEREAAAAGSGGGWLLWVALGGALGYGASALGAPGRSADRGEQVGHGQPEQGEHDAHVPR